MLLPCEADLVRRDGDLPGLGVILDESALCDTLNTQARIFGGSVTSVRIQYIRYKPGRRCLVLCRATVAGIVRELLVTAMSHSSWEKQRQVNAARLEQYENTEIDGSRISVVCFPEDRRLRCLRPLLNGEQIIPMLRPVLKRHPEWYHATFHRLAYRPMRRFVLRGDVDGKPRFVLKGYSRDTFQRASLQAELRLSDVDLPGARCLGVHSRHRLMAFEWQAGNTLADLIRNESSVSTGISTRLSTAVRQAAEILTKLHGCGLPTVRLPVAEYRLSTLAEDIAILCPKLAPAATEAVALLEQRFASNRESLVCIHGDYCPGQVIVNANSARMIDFDEAGAGQPEQDAGNFLAKLLFFQVCEEARSDVIQNCQKHFEDAWLNSSNRGDQHTLNAHVAAGLLRCVPLPFRRGMKNWPEAAKQLMQLASDRLNQRGGVCQSGGRYRFPESRRKEAPDASNPASRFSGSVSVRKIDRAHRPTDALRSASPEVTGWQEISKDEKLLFLGPAFDLAAMSIAITKAMRHISRSEFRVQSVKLLRHKPGRRCLIAYELCDDSMPGGYRTILGKVRARGLDVRSCDTQVQLHDMGFDSESADGISVPRPLGVIPELHMWLQPMVSGRALTSVIEEDNSDVLASRVNAAVRKLHHASIRMERCHTLTDELTILRDRLVAAGMKRPDLRLRIDRVFDRCHVLSERIEVQESRCIHRDLYPDQILVDDGRLWILDLDLCCRGPSLLDVGNFVAHVLEQSIRRSSVARNLRLFASKMAEDWQANQARESELEIWTALSLARHISISASHTERREFTEQILQATEFLVFSKR